MAYTAARWWGVHELQRAMVRALHHFARCACLGQMELCPFPPAACVGNSGCAKVAHKSLLPVLTSLPIPYGTQQCSEAMFVLIPRSSVPDDDIMSSRIPGR